MFGPNPQISLAPNFEANVSHRDAGFKMLYSQCRDLLKEKFELQDFDLLFVIGPSTVAMEIVLSSLDNKNVEVIGCDGKFSDRWKSLVRKYCDSSNEKLTLVTRLETSRSKFNHERADIVDCVSSFPFIKETKESRVLVFSVNKILSSLAGISVIAVRKDSWGLFRDSKEYSYLDIKIHERYSRDNQTACTAPVYSFLLLRESLERFDAIKMKEKIVENSKLLSNCLKSHLVGDEICPVVTFSKKAVKSSTATKFSLYGSQDSSAENYQIFTYSEADECYEAFTKEIESAS